MEILKLHTFIMAWSDDKLTKKLSITSRANLFHTFKKYLTGIRKINEKMALFHQMKMPKVPFIEVNFAQKISMIGTQILHEKKKKKFEARMERAMCQDLL